jgi:hypothetical protein
MLSDPDQDAGCLALPCVCDAQLERERVDDELRRRSTYVPSAAQALIDQAVEKRLRRERARRTRWSVADGA